jgi:hypothetical protein
MCAQANEWIRRQTNVGNDLVAGRVVDAALVAQQVNEQRMAGAVGAEATHTGRGGRSDHERMYGEE